MRLTQLDQDIYNLEKLNKELKESSQKKALQMRTTFMDPLVNDNFKALQEQVKEYEKKLKSAQEDLKAAQFNAEMYEGKQLINKCRRLHEENEEFGRQLSEGRVHKMEADLALEKKQNSELRDAIGESHDWVTRLDEELEEMQTKIFRLEGELKKYQDRERRDKQKEKDKEKEQSRHSHSHHGHRKGIKSEKSHQS